MRELCRSSHTTDIEPTQEWQDTIESALYTCDALLAYLTPDFARSNWTDQEVGFCLARDVLIVPVRMGADPHGFIAKYQGLQGSGKDIPDLADEVVDFLVGNPRTSAVMAAGAVAAFARVGSWNAGRKHYARIMRVPRSLWTPEMIEEARDGIANNNQVSECGIPNRGFVKDILPPYLDAIEASLS